jgi:tight adherence protein B
MKNKVMLFLKIILLSFTIGWVYYRHALGVVFIFVFILFLNKWIIPRNSSSKVSPILFKMFLNSIYTELLIGKSFRNALCDAKENLSFENEEFIMQVDTLIKDIHFQTNEIKAWIRFSESVDLYACHQFVDVLKATYSYGGQVTQVLKHTIKSITDEIDLELEIDIIIASKKYEFYGMIGIPFILMALLSYTQYDYMKVLYETFLGRIVMTFGFVLMLISYILGKKIVEIEV